jgi:hypothetical protein
VFFWGEFSHCGGRKRKNKKEIKRNPGANCVERIFLDKHKMQKSPYFEERK